MFERFLRSDEELSELSMAIEENVDAADRVVFTETIEEQDADAPVVRFVNLLIAQAINDRASDIHVEPGENQLTVRYRIDGVLHEMQKADRAIQDGIISRLKIMSSIDIAEKRRPQDGRLSVHARGPPDRPPRRDAADGVGREDRHAHPRQHRSAHGDVATC